MTFFQKALTFDLKEIFQFCFQILKDKRLIFNKNSGFYMGTKNKVKIRRQRRAKIEKINFCVFGAPLWIYDVIIKITYVSRFLLI